MVIDLEDLIWDMGAAEVLCPVRIHMVFIAVVRVWAMEEVLLVVVMLEGCTHPVMAVITCLVEQMLVVALTHLFIPVVVLVAAVTWVVVVLDHTIEIFDMTEAAVGCGLFEAYSL